MENIDKRKKVLMYYSFADCVGGPVTYINTIIRSPLNKKYQFVTCYQNCAPGGVNFALLRRMVRAIRLEAPDIVHVHGLQSEGLYGVLAAKFAGCKCIVTTVHGLAFDCTEYGKVKRMLYRRIVEPLTLRLSTKVYCVCEYASKRSIILRNTKERNYGYIHNPAPCMQITEGREHLRKRLNIADNCTVFVISSRIVKEKGYGVLEDAVRYLNNQNSQKQFKLLVLGDGDYRQEFETNLKKEIEAGQVIMIGLTDRVADYLSASDVFILPSAHENLPIALLEGGKMGLPCIASAVGGIPEIVKDGNTGFLIDGFNPLMYAEKMLFFIEHPEAIKRMGHNIICDISNRFSLDQFCEEIDNIYTS